MKKDVFGPDGFRGITVTVFYSGKSYLVKLYVSGDKRILSSYSI